jgi:hypothetical protein
LEKQKKEKDETDKKTSIDHNFSVINDFIQEKKPKMEYLLNTSYKKRADTPSETSIQTYPPDYHLVMKLDAIYNILKIVDERLQKLEQK